jgi:hypothetical protein
VVVRDDVRGLLVPEVVELTGLSATTIRRRCDAWQRGERTPYAIKVGRTGGDKGDRLIDPDDAERVRLQARGELDPAVTAEQYAAQQRPPG